MSRGTAAAATRSARWWMPAVFTIAGTIVLLFGFVAVDVVLSYDHDTQANPGETMDRIHQPDPVLAWVPLPGASGRHTYPGNFDASYTIDDEGFRVVPDSPGATRRLYLFGDSYTFGHGVDDADTFAARLASEHLSEEIQVVNAGVNGYGISQMLGRLERVAPGLAPGDFVVFTPISKDLRRDLEDFGYAYQFLIRGDVETYPVYRRGRIEAVDIRTPSNFALALLFNAKLTGRTFQKLHRRIMQPSSLEDAAAMFAAARRIAEERGAQFILVFLPRIKEILRGGYTIDLSAFDFRDIRHHFPTDEPSLMSLRFATDSHWNAAGHEVGARALAAVLAEHGLPMRDDRQVSADPPIPDSRR